MIFEMDKDRIAHSSYWHQNARTQISNSGGDFFHGKKDGYFRTGCKDQLFHLPRFVAIVRSEFQGPPLSTVKEE